MSGAPVELRVAGQTYRVVASAAEDELQRLASVVDERLRDMTAPGRQVSPQTLVLVAISLAHDLEEERAKRRRVESRSREMLSRLLQRIDAALESSEHLEQSSESLESNAQAQVMAPPESEL